MLTHRQMTARRERIVAAGLLIGTLALFSVRAAAQYRPHTYLFADCNYYAATAVSLVYDHDLDLRNQLRGGLRFHGGQIALGRDGAWYPMHPILMPIAAAPFLAAFGLPGLLVFNLLTLSGLALVLMRLARPLATPPAAAAAALTLILGTFVRRYDYNFSPDLFATLLVSLGVLAFVRGRDATGGVLLGLSVAAKLTHLFLLPFVLLYAGACRGRNRAARAAAAALPPLLCLMALNWLHFGSPWTTSYDVNVSTAGGTVSLFSHRAFFDQNVITGLAGELFDLQRGLLWTAPALLLAVPGFVLLLRRLPREGLLLLGLSEFLILLFATYRFWAASHYGNRFLMPVVAFASPAVALVFDHAAQWLRRRSDGAPLAVAGEAASHAGGGGAP